VKTAGGVLRPTKLSALALAALGVVFGDIGTSPLYSLQTIFALHNGAVQPTERDILGIISLITWCLIIIVSVAYAGFILRADNDGEGGILSLAALIHRKLGTGTSRAKAALILSVVGASLFFGDSFITPAISVLSAVEGLETVNPQLGTWVVPLALVILTVLFAVQRWGTAVIGRAFGPVMIVWFVVLALLGAAHIREDLSILRAVSPTYAIEFVFANPLIGFFALGAVVLAVTGVEALYADLGHFGRKPIVLAWFALVMPSLLLNYFGQGAMLLADPSTASNPFFHLAPAWGRIPLVVLATLATVIASQAVISGAFSVARQAVRRSLLPRLRVKHTSRNNMGQIYLPLVNWVLFVGVALLVVSFQSSTELAAAYGLSVTGTMLLELSLFLLLAHAVWQWPTWRVVALGAIIGGLELLLFAANAIKIASGGWVPLAVAAVFITVMLTWSRGAEVLFGNRAKLEGPLPEFVSGLRRDAVERVPGVAVYPHGNPETVPLALRGNVKFNRVVHEHVVIITMVHVGVPYVARADRIVTTPLGDPDDGIVQVLYRIGFNDYQDVPRALRQAIDHSPELRFDPDEAMYVLSVFRIEPGRSRVMAKWRKQLFRLLERGSANRTHVLHLPPERTIIVGAEVEF
jgi:KUP system potassium uptake protein